MQHISHHELVEQNYAQYRCEHNESRKHLERGCLRMVWIFCFHAQRFEKEFGFGEHDKVKDDGNNCKKQEGKNVASNDQEFPVMIRLINVLPDDFIGLRGFFHEYFDGAVGDEFIAELVYVKEVLAEVFALLECLLKRVEE